MVASAIVMRFEPEMVSAELKNFPSRNMTDLKKEQTNKQKPKQTKQNKKTWLDETAHSTSVLQLQMHCESKYIYRPIIYFL